MFDVSIMNSELLHVKIRCYNLQSWCSLRHTKLFLIDNVLHWWVNFTFHTLTDQKYVSMPVKWKVCNSRRFVKSHHFMRDYQGHHKSNVSFEFFISGNRALAGTIIGLELHYSTRNHIVFVVGYMLLCLVTYVNY